MKCIITVLLFIFYTCNYFACSAGAVGEISKQKCKEYSKVVKNCAHQVQELQSGVKLAEEDEFPHLAVLGYDREGTIQWSCDGTIISDQYILTAAHCLNSSLGAPTLAKIGVVNLKNDIHTQQFKIISIIKHPNYIKSSFYNDIGLVKLDRKIDLNSHIYPVCLNTINDIKYNKAILSGFGNPSVGNKREHLKKVVMDFVGVDDCSKVYDNIRSLKNGIDYESQLCVVSSTKDEDSISLSGDSLVVYHSRDDIQCMYDLIGFASFGKGFASNTAEVHTKVSHFIGWIEQTVWG